MVMEKVAAILVILVIAVVGLVIFLWAFFELFDFLRWIFPANKEDESGRFRED